MMANHVIKTIENDMETQMCSLGYSSLFVGEEGCKV